MGVWKLQELATLWENALVFDQDTNIEGFDEIVEANANTSNEKGFTTFIPEL